MTSMMRIEECEETESVQNVYCWEEQCLCAGEMGGMLVHPQDMSSVGYVKRIYAVFIFKNTMIHVEGKQRKDAGFDVQLVRTMAKDMSVSLAIVEKLSPKKKTDMFAIQMMACVAQ